MRTVHLLAVLCAVVLPAAACEEKPAPAPSTPPAPAPAAGSAETPTRPAAETATPGLPEHMKEHFTRGVKIRDAVIAGDLAATKKDAQWMAEHELSASFPEAWKPHVTNFQDAAKKLLDSKALDTAAEAVAGMALSCGSCHAALGGPKLSPGAPPAEGSGTTPHMARHQWAAERMWDALVTPSEEAWLKATETMADAPLVPTAVSGQKSVDKKVDTLAVSVHDIAEKARADRDMKKWATAYGKFLQTCAGCHRAAGGPPSADQ